MFEKEAQLHKAADEIVTQMLDDDIAQKKFYTDERLGKEYWNLVTPNAFDKELIVVGTDGHRLAMLKKKIDSEMKEEKKIIIPRKAVSELRRFLPTAKKSEGADVERVRILIGEKHMLFVIKGVQFLTRLIEGTYPSYENVIPHDNKKHMSIERDNFSKVLRRIFVGLKSSLPGCAGADTTPKADDRPASAMLPTTKSPQSRRKRSDIAIGVG